MRTHALSRLEYPEGHRPGETGIGSATGIGTGAGIGIGAGAGSGTGTGSGNCAGSGSAGTALGYLDGKGQL
ncbi:unnamed protein product [Soboliphyme baturini]|uniref:Uncharacterized protein n=1 Tax=Soboliphyme baturini TaxID=241478 RepID=A0A183J718_9BILA|nr:unnamed protein product [Soboliphyme baturini]